MVTALQRAGGGVIDRAQRLLQPLQGKKGEDNGSDDAEMRAGVKAALSRAEVAVAQAEIILKQLDRAAEELFMQVWHMIPTMVQMTL